MKIDPSQSFKFLKNIKQDSKLDQNSLKFIIDASCPSAVENTLELLGYPYSVKSECSYNGEKI